MDYGSDAALSKLQIPFQAGAGLGVTVSSMGRLSYQSAYRKVRGNESSMEGVTFPLFMAVIYVDMGKVTGITWDNTCNWCENGNRCDSNVYDFDGTLLPSGGNCYVEDSSCATLNGTTRLCELNASRR